MGIYYGRSNIELYLTKVTMSFTWLAAALLAAQRLSYTLEYPRVSLSLSLSLRHEKMPFTLQRRQFPVRPAFAMTINKF